MIVYGPIGVGKTEFAANFPDVGFLHDNQEDGINDLVEYGRCKQPNFVNEVDGFEDTLQKLDQIAADQGVFEGSKPIKHLCIDGLTGLERLCFEYHCREYYNDDWSNEGFYSFYKGPKNAAKRDWPRLIRALIDVWKAGISVIILAHSQVGDSDNPTGADFKKFTPTIDKQVWAQTSQWAKCIVYYGMDTDTEKVGTKTKAKSASYDRNLYTDTSPHYDAKNRYGLSPVIPAGDSGAETYANFAADLAKARKVKRIA